MLLLGAAALCRAALPAVGSVPPKYKLVQLQVVVLHGARAPYSDFMSKEERGVWRCDSTSAISGRIEATPVTFPRRIRTVLDPRLADYPPSCVTGDLTVAGMEQMQNLGKAYHSWHTEIGFLSESLNPSELAIRSTSATRNFKAAVAFLNGLYEPESKNEFVDITATNVFTPAKQCKAIMKLNRDYKASKAYRQLVKEMEEKMSDCKSFFGNQSYVDTAEQICEWITTMSVNGQPLPSKVTDDHIDFCQTVRADILFGTFFPNNESSSIGFSAAMRAMTELMNDFVAQATSQKLVVVTVDEDSICAMLSLLQNRRKKVPKFGSHLELQLLRDKAGKLFIRFVLNGKPLTLPSFDNSELVRLDTWAATIGSRIDSVCI